MSAVAEAPITLADVLNQLGVSPERVRFRPAPGMARVQDVVDLEVHENRLYELVEGVLVEKIMGFLESLVATELSRLLGNFVKRNDLGLLTGPDGAIGLAPGLVRIPDVSFFAWGKFSGRKRPLDPIPDLVPDLAVEILSEGNTDKEMTRKVREYFDAGVRLVWLIDPVARVARVYTSARKSVLLSHGQTLTGGKVLPGFKLPLRKLFEDVSPQE